MLQHKIDALIDALNAIENVRAGYATDTDGNAREDVVKAIAPVTDEPALGRIDDELRNRGFKQTRQGEKDGRLFMEIEEDDTLNEVLDW